ncbi:peptide deformylase [sulfur-oxidizing endosymbiont of Gigantopelta aegis]|uniref:peptide deformylase n=1 Tax=sulfur-oxidizing endosymbiont of Gigantopelta aegis TaxID=2794934 RepID=UPI0018DCF09D|nr:peptide deformylase [sulfur-oxidizing endosymbiont of Gigantopelta aegis]
MSILEIVTMGDPRLALVASPVVDFQDETLALSIADMVDTMRHYQGVGLAAPQIGLSKQILVLEVDVNERYPQAESIALNVLINPTIIAASDEQESAWEGCLSLPGLRGKVARAAQITYRAQSPTGDFLEKTVTGFHARIIQHEIDHLKGVLYPQQLTDLHDFGFEDSLPGFNLENSLEKPV